MVQVINKEYFPQPINNWMNESIYKKERTNKEWGWEFLRRNKSYQYDVSRYQLNADFEEYELIEIDAGKEFDKRFVKLPEESDGFTIRKSAVPLGMLLAKKYGFKWSTIYCFKSELTEDHGVILDPKASGIGICGYHHQDEQRKDEQRALSPRNEAEYVVRFDLKGSIEKQIKQAKLVLKTRAEMEGIKEVRPPKDKSLYIIYLRLLDAIAENPKITNLELAAELCRHKLDDEENAKKTIRNWKASSKKLVESDYIRIMTS